MNVVIAWLMSFMVAMVPPTMKQWYPEAKEAPEAASARYESIATDVSIIVWDPANPPLFKGPYGREKTAAVLESIMLHEGHFRRDVDYGLGKWGRGDGGRSWCLMQIRFDSPTGGKTRDWNKTRGHYVLPSDPKTDEIEAGWTGPELIQDRQKCILTGYRYVQNSFKQCAKLDVLQWLRVYAKGNCDEGEEQSKARMGTAINWFNNHRPPFTDKQALQLLTPPTKREVSYLLPSGPEVLASQ